ncbi:hypothetical protein FFK22_024580 [Mycobacterium sp. KBS0706]|uniref:hypothetical protein n=1 Tax=Mycobacterium sp. KBS0706 TaxID=2578109 RepID=UPI00110FDDAC|nr:hypothetical protein [Mycobacterium sp. KBS0706]TSD85999.1 hypothetical protein FFK22_024580 [Mycobacterium sp. KBS0706]
MNSLEAALCLARLNRIFQQTRGLSRSAKWAANETVFTLAAALMRIQTPARSAPDMAITRDDARTLVSGVVEIMEGAGIARPDIAVLFNIVIRGLPSPAARPPLPTPEIPNGFVLVRDDVLTSLAAGMPVSATESADAP